MPFPLAAAAAEVSSLLSIALRNAAKLPPLLYDFESVESVDDDDDDDELDSKSEEDRLPPT